MTSFEGFSEDSLSWALAGALEAVSATGAFAGPEGHTRAWVLAAIVGIALCSTSGVKFAFTG
jgi:hypothetical protein